MIFLVLASVLPFLLLIAIVARRQLVEEKPLAAAGAFARARQIADDVDILLRDIETTAHAITHSVSANPLDRADNDRTLRAISAQTRHPFTSWLILTPAGDLIGSSVPGGDLDDPGLFRSLVEPLDFRTRRFITGPVNLPSAGYAIHMLVPMQEEGGNRAFLAARILLRAFRPILDPRGLPEGSSLTIHSEKGIVLGRFPDPDKWVGSDISGTPVDSVAATAFDGPSEFTTRDGIHRLLAVARVQEAPWRAGVGVPTGVLLARARADFARTLGYGGLALVLALALALWQASRIIGPVRRLSADAAKLGAGNLSHRSDVSANDELGALASTMNEMATTLEHHGAVLRESEERYRKLFSINPLPMWVFDAKSLAMLAVNRAATEVYGYSEEEFLGMKASDMRLESDGPELLRRVRESGAESRSYLSRHKRKDGTLMDVEIDAGPITFGDKPARLVVVQDVTERLRAEEALRAAELQLRKSQRLEAIGQLTGGIAHDFNNVLTAIGSYSDFLYESLDPGDARRLDVQEIRKAADRAAGLTKQLLAFSRSQILQPRVLDVNETVRELEALLRRLLRADIELVFKLDPNVGNVRADPGQLAQVLMNLAVNARDAMPGGGMLTISSRSEQISEPERPLDGDDPMAVKAGDYVVIEIADTGSGMDRETMQRIFEPFFTTKGPGMGTGLGLSTVHGIIHQSGGNVAVDSDPGTGTTFTIRLPRVQQAVEPDAPKPERAVAGQRSELILVVEDEEAVRRATKRILVKKGYTVLEAGNGSQALELLQSLEKVDLLLTDLVMPGMGGRELVRALREQGRTIPTVYMSGYTRDAVMRAELDPDIPVLEKPFSQEELAAKVRAALDGNGKY